MPKNIKGWIVVDTKLITRSTWSNAVKGISEQIKVLKKDLIKKVKKEYAKNKKD